MFDTHPYATVTQRVIAATIDGTVIGALFVVFSFILGASADIPTALRTILLLWPLFILEPILLRLLGQTVGQMLVRIRVVSINPKAKLGLLAINY